MPPSKFKITGVTCIVLSLFQVDRAARQNLPGSASRERMDMLMVWYEVFFLKTRLFSRPPVSECCTERPAKAARLQLQAANLAGQAAYTNAGLSPSSEAEALHSSKGLRAPTLHAPLVI